jgi:hypothetical protein
MSIRLRRLVCVVEGQGEIDAIPCLCTRIRDLLGVTNWFVDPNPVKQSRSRLVDERTRSPFRSPAEDGLRRAVSLAAQRPADAVLVICDADDDCAATWGREATRIVRSIAKTGGAVMVVREYETWFLLSTFGKANVGDVAIESIRGAKERFRGMYPTYKASIHQKKYTSALNLTSVWALSNSFDKMVRTLGDIFEATGVSRPLVT